MKYDTVVIGGGVAGVSAALERAAEGKRVALVRAGPGATALTSGAWHGPMPPHLAAALAAVGLPYLPTSRPLPHPHGDLVTCAYAAASHVLGLGSDTAVLGIAGLAGFPASALVRLWGAGSAHTIELRDTPAAGWSPVSLAAAIDRDPALLAEPLRAFSGQEVLLPAVVGLDPATRERVQSISGATVREALGATPSIPGWRLDAALLGALARADIALITGRVGARVATGDRLQAVRVNDAELSADEFVLATGRFVGGGIRAADVTDALEVARGRALREAPLIESALGCDVWIEHLGERFTQVQPVPLTDAVRGEAQALLRAGVHVDAQGRPLDGGGAVRYANVFARGGVVARTAHGLGPASSLPEVLA